jgi:glutamate racemase
MDNRPIGVFDSGVGGLTAVREIRKLMPRESIVYFGDTGRVPYGTRSKETILKYAKQAISFVNSHNVKAFIAACGTISAVLDEKAFQELGQELKIDAPYTGVVMPATRTACAMSAGGRLGIIATPAAIRSGAYGRAVRSISPSTKVFGNACPLLVPLVENGITSKDDPIARLTVEMYLKPLIREEIDTLILGCTHFPLLYDVINDVLDYKVTLIDPSAAAVKEMRQRLMRADMLADEDAGSAKTEYYVTDAAEQVAEIAKAFLQEDIAGKITRIDLDMIEG